MGVELLDKTRRINSLLKDNRYDKVVFSDLCSVLSEVLDSYALVISSKGKVLGQETGSGDCAVLDELSGIKVGDRIGEDLNQRFLAILSTKENAGLELLGFRADEDRRVSSMVVPVVIGSDRLGTLFLYRSAGPYGIDDIILGEYGATVVSLEMLRSLSEEQESLDRQRQDLESAFSTLSPAERQAVIALGKYVSGPRTLVVTSHIADSEGITRSVIVNAMKKLESAGIIATRSAGMRGTYIKVLNDVLLRKIGQRSLKDI